MPDDHRYWTFHVASNFKLQKFVEMYCACFFMDSFSLTSTLNAVYVVTATP